MADEHDFWDDVDEELDGLEAAAEDELADYELDEELEDRAAREQ